MYRSILIMHAVGYDALTWKLREGMGCRDSSLSLSLSFLPNECMNSSQVLTLSLPNFKVFHNYCAFHVLVQTNFRSYCFYFLLFVRSSSNSPRPFQRFRQTLRRNFNWIRQQMKNFHIDRLCKNCPLSATL